MKTFLILTALFSSGGAVAVQNDTAQESVKNNIHKIKEMFQHRKGGYDLDSIQENGFPYPSEEVLEQLTEEQAFEITSFIDQVNAEYDFSTMTEEELETAVDEIKDELEVLYEELGVEGLMKREREGHPSDFGQEVARRARARRGNPFRDILEDEDSADEEIVEEQTDETEGSTETEETEETKDTVDEDANTA